MIIWIARITCSAASRMKLVLARRCGLNAASTTTGITGNRSYLLVTRYDRTFADGHWTRLHQEDFYQALGKPPAAK
jgi:serine/threonine-protein kinase HipA